jgi:hypothetical protein
VNDAATNAAATNDAATNAVTPAADHELQIMIAPENDGVIMIGEG